jgi:hypothetical protein
LGKATQWILVKDLTKLVHQNRPLISTLILLLTNSRHRYKLSKAQQCSSLQGPQALGGKEEVRREPSARSLLSVGPAGGERVWQAGVQVTPGSTTELEQDQEAVEGSPDRAGPRSLMIDISSRTPGLKRWRRMVFTDLNILECTKLHLRPVQIRGIRPRAQYFTRRHCVQGSAQHKVASAEAVNIHEVTL